jgi:hypothetical protein
MRRPREAAVLTTSLPGLLRRRALMETMTLGQRGEKGGRGGAARAEAGEFGVRRLQNVSGVASSCSRALQFSWANEKTTFGVERWLRLGDQETAQKRRGACCCWPGSEGGAEAKPTGRLDGRCKGRPCNVDRPSPHLQLRPARLASQELQSQAPRTTRLAPNHGAAAVMPKRKSRGQSSLFASLPQELRQTITSSLATTAIVAAPPAAAVPASPKVGSKRPASDDAGPNEETDVVIKRRRPWSKEDEKRGLKHPWDCEGLVARYDRTKRVPVELRKCQSLSFAWERGGEGGLLTRGMRLLPTGLADYAQRHRLFSLYDDLPLLLDHEGWYSVTPERIAIQIAERMRCGSEWPPWSPVSLQSLC